MDINKREVTIRHYSIPVTVEEFRAIEGLDNIVSRPLYEKIASFPGVRDVDYNGCFGSFIFMQVEAEHDTQTLWSDVERTINRYIAT